MSRFRANRSSPAERLLLLCGKEPLPKQPALAWRKTNMEQFCEDTTLAAGNALELCGATGAGKTQLGLSAAETLLSRGASCVLIDQDHGARSWLLGPFKHLFRQGLVVLLPRSPEETHQMVVHAISCGAFDLVLLDSLGFVCEPGFRRDSVQRWLDRSSRSRATLWLINPLSPFGGAINSGAPPGWYPCSGHPGARDLSEMVRSRVWVEAPGVLWVRKPELSL